MMAVALIIEAAINLYANYELEIQQFFSRLKFEFHSRRYAIEFAAVRAELQLRGWLRHVHSRITLWRLRRRMGGELFDAF
jgi:hypothetical protein